MLNAILVDDESHCLRTLSLLLSENCPEIKIVDQLNSAKAALTSIKKHHPDLLFLDIEMPLMNGFELLEQIGEINFSLIFTTSYDQYAIKAIRFSALDYLLKPISARELVEAVAKAKKQVYIPSQEKFKMLFDALQNKQHTFSKIAVSTTEGFELIPQEQILFCEADDNYTTIFLKSGARIVACRTLKDVEEQLESFGSFIRVHHSYIANLNEVARYVRGEGGYLVMSSGATVNVSRSRKEALMKYF